ncbi:MAG: ABC transporter substrate-binding protein [Alphaproteobacteria bacterium]|nr:ABC transporter substrate-binding protein [Alphaproteobacteria bacterium]
MLTVGMVLEPPNLDPTAGAAAAIDEVVYANVFEGLTRIDHNGKVQPALAKSWTISANGLTYQFILQDSVTFHDGSPFTAEDVVFSFNRAKAPDSVNAQKEIFEPIQDMKVIEKNKLVIILKRPVGDFLSHLGWGDAVIVSSKTVGNNKTNPIGTGPFIFKDWVRGDHITLAKYENYWGKKPFLQTIVFKFIAEPAAAVSSLLAGDVDVFPNFPAPESLSVFQKDSNFKVVIGNTEGETILALNNAQKPFQDLKVRQALNMAINRQAIIEGSMSGYGIPIGSHFSPIHSAYVDLSNYYPYDIERAKELLKQAGYPNGFDVTLKLPPPSYARRSGEIIAAQLKALGIKVKIIPMEWAQWLEQVFKNKDYEMTIVSHTEPMDINIYARDNYYFNYPNSKFKDLYKKFSLTMNNDQQTKILRELQTLLAKDAVNVFLFQLPKLGVWKSGIIGLWDNSPIQANDLTGVMWQTNK